MRLVTPCAYRCDKCRARVYGYWGELPEGWVERTTHPDGYVDHYCPMCITPESESPHDS